jgi:hypothetical protein
MTTNSTVLQLMARLPEWVDDLDLKIRLLEQTIATLEQTKYKAIWQLFCLDDVVEFVGLSEDQVVQRIHERTAESAFQDQLLCLYDKTGLSSGRVGLIREALDLHREKRFAGSVVLFYSQIEGILGDALVAFGFADAVEHKFHALEWKRARLVGVHDKLELARDRTNLEIYASLLGDCMAGDAVELRFSTSRNRVLHGSELDFANAEHSTQLILWLAALLQELTGLQNAAA